ncbi:integrase core domain-containing protein, partial [Micrococcus aloeverae]|nr:integrase core domain-containing protein [Micrococcus luteus]
PAGSRRGGQRATRANQMASTGQFPWPSLGSPHGRQRVIPWPPMGSFSWPLTHSDAGSQFTSIRYGERLAEIGATPSIGTVGDSYDNALAETVNGYYKAEHVRGPARPGPWRTVEDLELATLGWVSWHNTQRLHGYLGDVPPAEFEDTFYAVEAGREQLVGIK